MRIDVKNLVKFDVDAIECTISNNVQPLKKVGSVKKMRNEDTKNRQKKRLFERSTKHFNYEF